MGSLLDLNFVADNFIYVILLAIGVILLKMIIIGITALILRYPARTIFLTVFSIFQVGEFSLLLSTVGLDNGLLPTNIYQYFLAISIITMALTPFLMNYAPNIAYFLLKIPIPKNIRKRLHSYHNLQLQAHSNIEELKDHLVIIGYGINGKNISKAAKSASIPHVIVDLEQEAFQEAKKK